MSVECFSSMSSCQVGVEHHRHRHAHQVRGDRACRGGGGGGEVSACRCPGRQGTRLGPVR